MSLVPYLLPSIHRHRLASPQLHLGAFSPLSPLILSSTHISPPFHCMATTSTTTASGQTAFHSVSERRKETTRQPGDSSAGGNVQENSVRQFGEGAASLWMS